MQAADGFAHVLGIALERRARSGPTSCAAYRTSKPSHSFVSMSRRNRADVRAPAVRTTVPAGSRPCCAASPISVRAWMGMPRTTSTPSVAHRRATGVVDPAPDGHRRAAHEQAVEHPRGVVVLDRRERHRADRGYALACNASRPCSTGTSFASPVVPEVEKYVSSAAGSMRAGDGACPSVPLAGSTASSGTSSRPAQAMLGPGGDETSRAHARGQPRSRGLAVERRQHDVRRPERRQPQRDDHVRHLVGDRDADALAAPDPLRREPGRAAAGESASSAYDSARCSATMARACGRSSAWRCIASTTVSASQCFASSLTGAGSRCRARCASISRCRWRCGSPPRRACRRPPRCRPPAGAVARPARPARGRPRR